MRLLAWCIALLLIAAPIAWVAGPYCLTQIVAAVVLGWLQFLYRVAPKVTNTWSGAISLLICLVPLAIGLHIFLSWFYASMAMPDGSPRPARRQWRVRWSAALLGVVLLMFVAGISAAGIAHQVGWLVRDRSQWTEYFDFSAATRNNLHQVGSSLSSPNLVEQPGMLPAGATFDADGRPLHGWQTLVLPQLFVRIDNIDLEIPWNDPRNADNFKTFVPQYLNPAIPVVRNRDGFGLSHYAGNVHVLSRRPTPLAQLPNGASNTLLIGEVASNFRPWGDPMSGRDPTAGLNTTPDGFTSVSGDAVDFAFADGSVRSVRREADPKVLKAMAGVPRKLP